MHRRLKTIIQPFRTLPSLVRIVIGILLILGGLLGALPILGFWMIPLGLLVLSLDFRWARKSYLAIILWFRRRRQARLAKKQSTSTNKKR